MENHPAFLERFTGNGVEPVPLSRFEVQPNSSPIFGTGQMPMRSLAAFEIHRTIEDQERPEFAGRSRLRSFHHVRRIATVAGMVRNATATAARRLGWAEEEVVGRILGHVSGDSGRATSDDRVQFLPLPSLTPNGIAGVRRILLVGPAGCDLSSLRRSLHGEELIDQDTQRPVAMLSWISAGDPTDRNVGRYLGAATTWTTVSPVILPGYDDPAGLRGKPTQRDSTDQQNNRLARVHARTMALIWKAFHQAGWTPDALAGAEVEYRSGGWIPGLETASRYELPPLRFPRYHLCVRFTRPVDGPLAIGAGRYRGLGLFASLDE